MIEGRMEVTVKFNAVPTATASKDKSRLTFVVQAGGREVEISVKPKTFNKIVEAAAQWPRWVCAVTGKMGAPRKNGFVLDDAAVQVFEVKAKEGASAAAATSAAPMPAKSAPVATATPDGRVTLLSALPTTAKPAPAVPLKSTAPKSAILRLGPADDAKVMELRGARQLFIVRREDQLVGRMLLAPHER